ncbi:GtrA family protein [Streptomyces phyllanthi]|uniref:GtrA family protein n=1 Tax=Streptomyces phyllanthi TaxID=1803180 RepID=UPI002AD3A7C9|nr:GtrA family protein [Streptomyces phyllanthi]
MLGQIARFALTGVFNTATYYGLYLLLLRATVPYLAAHVLAFAVSVVGSFFANCWFTWRTGPTWRKFAVFPLTVAANFTLTTVGVCVATEVLGADNRTAPLLATALAVPVTFLATRSVMLRRTGHPATGEPPHDRAPHPTTTPHPATDRHSTTAPHPATDRHSATGRHPMAGPQPGPQPGPPDKVGSGRSTHA